MRRLWEIGTFVEGADGPGQDLVAAIERPEHFTLVLADGAGGISGGAEAADAVVLAATERARQSGPPPDAAAWVRLLADIDTRLADRAGGETTAVVISIDLRTIAGASVGDSGALWITDAGTWDLTERQHRRPRLGSGVAVPYPFGAPFAPGTLVLASDGLLAYVAREAIVAAARNGSAVDAARRLADLPRLRSGARPDDVSVCVCRILP